jgi:hypothetical protein
MFRTQESTIRVNRGNDRQFITTVVQENNEVHYYGNVRPVLRKNLHFCSAVLGNERISVAYVEYLGSDLTGN